MIDGSDGRRDGSGGAPRRDAGRRGGGVVVGIGNPLRGDDAAGIEIARALEGRATLAGCPVIFAFDTPENHLDVVRKHQPSWVLLIDAANLGERCGESAIVRMGRGATFAPGTLPSTHRPSLSVLTTYIEKEIGAEVWLLGMQPRNLEPGHPMSAEVTAGIDAAADLAHSWIQRRPAAMEA